MSRRPKSSTELLVTEMSGEGLVYDLRAHRAHCLDATTFAVFKQLDGKKSVSQIADAAGGALGKTLDPAVVEAALDELVSAGLIAEAPAPIDVGRRRAASQIGLTLGLSVAAPAVWSIVAPTVAEAASLVACVPATNCAKAGDCCGTPGGAAKTCNKGGLCGNNAGNSPCRGKVCQ